MILSLTGDLIEKDQELELINEIENQIGENKNNFVLDLAQLIHINSSGFSVLINILTKSRNSGGDVIVANVSDKMKELFIITKLHTVFTITENIEEAIDALTVNSL